MLHHNSHHPRHGGGAQRPSTPAPSRTPLTGGAAPSFVSPPDVVSTNDTRIMLHMLLSEARVFHDAKLHSLRRPVTPARPAPELQSVVRVAATPLPPDSTSFCSSNGSFLGTTSPGSVTTQSPAARASDAAAAAAIVATGDTWCPSPGLSPELAGGPPTEFLPPPQLRSIDHDKDVFAGHSAATTTTTTTFTTLPNDSRTPHATTMPPAAGDDNHHLHHQLLTAVHESTGAPPIPAQMADETMGTEDDDASVSSYDGWADLQTQIEALWHEPLGNEAPTQRYIRLKTYLTWLFIWDPARDWDEFEEVSAAASLDWIQTRQAARLRSIPPGKLFHDAVASA